MDQDMDDRDWIPKHLAEDIRRQISALTKESGRMATIECSEAVIRHWCEAIEDGNRLYLDPEYAQSQGFSGIVAPPTILGALTIPYRWPRPDGNVEDTVPLNFRLKALMNLAVGVVVATETEFVRFVEVGDRLFLSSRLISITGPKQTRIGTGYFWVIESIARNQRDEIISRGRTTHFSYDPGLPPEGSTPAEVFSKETEDALEAERSTHLPADRHAYWDEVREGDTLPTLLMPITVTRCVYIASGTRNFAPHHSNRDYAQQKVKARDMFLNTPFNSGILSRFVTDWAGPESRIRKLKLEMQENICAGDDMIINGVVSRKYAEGGDSLVDIDIQVSTQHGPAYNAAISLVLPLRSDPQA
jgi:acyl dehydratase